ncbi:MAG TPA: phosphoribosyl-ATP diphosphatase [Xanthobacteraceae bacterium]
MTDSIDRLYLAIVAAKSADPATSRTARLLHGGRAKTAKKLVEEAVEVVIDALEGNNAAVIKESADLIYNLAALWVVAGVEPREVWAEMERRERLFGIAEKLPKEAFKEALEDGLKGPAEPPPRRHVVALEGRRLRKRR